MKKNNRFLLLTLDFILLFTISACSNRGIFVGNSIDNANNVDHKKYLEVEYNKSNLSVKAVASASGSAINAEKTGYVAAQGKVDGENASEVHSTGERVPDKIIYHISMEVETKKFDNFMETIEQKLNEINGYVESSEITSPKYQKKSSYRDAKFVARVLGDKATEFMNIVGGEATVINVKRTSENVGLQYIDIKKRKEAVKIEQEKLLSFIKKSKKVKDIVALETRLNSITFELEQYESQMRNYDNQEKYTTVTLLVDEVDRMVPGKEENGTLGNRMKSGFSGSVRKMQSAFENVAVWLATNCIYIMISMVLMIIAIISIKRMVRKRNEKDTKKTGRKAAKKPVKSTVEKTGIKNGKKDKKEDIPSELLKDKKSYI